MDEYTIVEATETPMRNSGDGLPRDTAPPVDDHEETIENSQDEKIDDTNGPWQELDALERHKKMLDTGYMSDVTIKVQEQTFRSHKNIISASSPKLSRMIRNNPRTLQLQNVAPKHFRHVLEIIYVGKAEKLDKVDDVLSVARTSRELQVYSAVAYCAKLLRSLINATSACQVLEFALQINDEGLKEACVKVIREQTDAVLKSDSFINCNLTSLQVILSQEIVHAVTELDLFLACARWAEKRTNPRQAFGSALSLIRFRVLTAKDFAKFVIPSKLLTVKEERNLMFYFLTGEGEMPEGFSNEQNERKLFLEKSKIKVGIQDNIFFAWSHSKYMISKEINACPPLRFSANRDINLIGLNVWSYREGKKKGDKYTEDSVVILKDKNGKIIASAKFCEEVQFNSSFCVRFSSPVPINENIIYNVHYITKVTGVRHDTVELMQYTIKSKNNVEIQVLENVYTTISDLIIES